MSEASGSLTQAPPPDPDYITYLLDPEQEYNCYFLVGNSTLNIPIEKIGVVKKMLLAHSVVFRAELQSSELAEKKDVRVTDMYPDTFKNMLRYAYGYDVTAVLTFDEADDLLYAAEKYMIVNLKNKLASHLISLLSHKNICSLMNNPACYKMLELSSEISKILQFETSMVLRNPQFLNLSPGAFLNILKQEILSVNEIEVWKSAIKWAKNRAKSEDGPALRNELTNHLQHIRLCSISYEEICNEVLPTEVLHLDEFQLVCESHKSRKILPELITICNLVQPRVRQRTKLLEADFTLNQGCLKLSETTMLLEIKDLDLEIDSVEVTLRGVGNHKCEGSVTFTENGANIITFALDQQLDTSLPWNVATVKNGINLVLESRKSYILRTKFTCGHLHYAQYSSSNFADNHMNVSHHRPICYITKHSNPGKHVLHVNKIKYRTLIKEDQDSDLSLNQD